MAADVKNLTDFIFKIANLLRGPYRRPQYRKVMLPMTVLRRLDCVLEPSKQQTLAEFEKMGGLATETVEKILMRRLGLPFVNTSKFTLASLLNDPEHIAANLLAFINGFSRNVQTIIEHFDFEQEILKLDQPNRLFEVVKAFAKVDLHPDRMPNIVMGTLFEELIREYNEQANEEAGDHFTPREVIRLMVHLLFAPDSGNFGSEHLIKTIYDPVCGTGGMLSEAEAYVREHCPALKLEVFGQEFNDESYAICGSDLMLKGENTARIAFGDTLGDGRSGDGHPFEKFDYMLSNPPFGVEWKVEEDVVRKEYEKRGFQGRFGPGLPRINDGALLFLLHMWSKRKPPEEGGSRVAVVFNGSPLFTGDAGSGESEIRRWIIENDWLEAIVALPDQMFYNTGISTYVWIVSNRKAIERRGRVQLINGTGYFAKMKKSLGNKRNELKEAHIDTLVRLYADQADQGDGRVFPNQEFGTLKLTVERPLRLNFQASEQRLKRLGQQTAFKALGESKKRKDKGLAEQEITAGKKQQKLLIEVLGYLDPNRLYRDRAEFAADLNALFQGHTCKLPTPQRKAILAALAERDETAAICREGDTADGAPEPDPELRDTETVPLPGDAPLPLPLAYGDTQDNAKIVALFRAHCDAWFEREVKPHVSDAWIDYDKTKVGFEIPFNRHFYQYQPPRPLAEIEADLKTLEADILRMLAEITA